MSLPPYPTYQQASLEWVESLPEHWGVKPLKRNVELLTEKTDSNECPVGLENLEGWTGRFIETESDFQGEGVGFDANDILFGKLRPYLAKVWLADRKGEAVGDFHVLHPLSGSVPRFVQYQLLTKEVIDLVNGSTYGAKMPRASWDFLGSLGMPTPSEKEQTAIASFLDRETANIDALIGEQQRLIELLQEKRQAVISHAVTKGLNPNAPMKDSGVEWLGEVPEHWSIKRLKHVSPQLTVGIVVNPSSYVAEDGLPFIYGGDIREGSINWKEARRITPNKSEEQPKTRLSEGDLVVVRVGAPGVTAVVPGECDGGNCASVMIVRRGDYSSQWLCYVMNTRVVRFQVEVVQYGAAQEQFNIGHAVNFWVPVPPREEQEHIVNNLDIESNKTSRLIAEAEQSILLLRERRSALVSAAVTGQIDVRGLVKEEEP
jgi:type I restriction enzyme S subunit